MTLMVPQLEMFTGIGAMKSLISDVNEDDERPVTIVLPKAWHVPEGKTPAVVRSIAVSPKVNAGRLLGALGAIGSVTAPRLFTDAIESVPSRVTLSPQHGNEFAEKQVFVAKFGTTGTDALVSQRSKATVGLPPPLSKS